MVVFDGNYPLAYTDLDTPLGKGFVYIRNWHSADAGDPRTVFRGNGEALATDDVDHNHLVYGKPNLDEVRYNFVPLDEYGVVEWLADNAYGCELRAEALSQ